MKHLTVIADLNVLEKKSNSDLSFFLLILFKYTYVSQKLWFYNGICNFSNIFSIKNSFLLLFLNVKT